MGSRLALPAGGGGSLVLLEHQQNVDQFGFLCPDPADYSHLRLVFQGRLASVASVAGSDVLFNGDAGANYSLSYHRALNSASSAGVVAGATGCQVLFPDEGAGANLFGSCIFDVFNFGDTDKFTMARAQQCAWYGVVGANAYSEIRDYCWENLAAVQNIITAGALFVSGSSCDLYGIE